MINSTGRWPQTLLILDKEELQVIRSQWSELSEQKQFAPFAFRDAAKSVFNCPAPDLPFTGGYRGQREVRLPVSAFPMSLSAVSTVLPGNASLPSLSDGARCWKCAQGLRDFGAHSIGTTYSAWAWPSVHDI